MKRYSTFLSEKFALWAYLGNTSDNWDKLLIAITPILIKEIKKAIKKNEEESKSKI